MNEFIEANQAYGALTEGLYLAGSAFERAMARTLGLLKSGGWRQVGPGFDDVNDFVRLAARPVQGDGRSAILRSRPRVG